MATTSLSKGLVLVAASIAVASVGLPLLVDTSSAAVQVPPAADACPPAANTVGFCAGQSDCPAGGGACACPPGSSFCCPPGFCYTRDIAGCQQEQCPSGVGRHDDDTCACDPPKQAVYDPCRPGFLVSCGPAGEAAPAGEAGAVAPPHTVVRTIDQPEQREGGKVTVEASKIEVIECDGGQFYIYEYLNRHGFRAIKPPDWGHALGGRDFNTKDEAIATACSGAGSNACIPNGRPCSSGPSCCSKSCVCSGIREENSCFCH